MILTEEQIKLRTLHISICEKKQCKPLKVRFSVFLFVNFLNWYHLLKSEI